VLVAAGLGRRAPGEVAKQFREIAGIPMLLRAVRPFLAHPMVASVVAVVPADTAAAPPRWLAEIAPDRLQLVAGGTERVDSVERGVAALGSHHGLIMVHDGARPFVDRAVIDAVIAAARGADGAIAALPVSDTIKQTVEHSPTISATVPRTALWRAQTPQAFPSEWLRRGLAHARSTGVTPTDDAAMVEAIGGRVALVVDRATNIKVTTPEDFLVAEALARGSR
jgi:2-C-methyl-D-erythritol 4-phosphate cytidylyltransferase